MRSQTSIKNNGISNSQAGANAVKEKWKTMSNEERKSITDRISNTLFERYGVYHALQYDLFLQKAQNTNLNKYGFKSYSQVEEFRNKIKQFWNNSANKQQVVNNLQKSLLKKYGYNNASQIPEVKAKKLEKYLSKSFEQKYFSILKRQETQRKNNNGLLWCQTHLAHKKHKPHLIFNDIIFDSLPELNVYKYCYEQHIPCIYQPEDDILLYYGIDNQIHAYHPDFRINGHLVEVKGSQFFNNKGELYCPFARDKPDIDIRDGNALCKYKLMIQNNVVILIDGNLEKLKEIL